MTVEHRGWEVVRLNDGDVEVDVVPRKGGDIIAIRHRGQNLLWESPWGLRERGDAPTGTASAERWLQMYPGGWQTIFPNGGDEAEGLGFHGDACLVAYDHVEDGNVLRLRARGVHGADIDRTIRVRPDGLDVTESIENTTEGPLEAMWSHHPAFGAPLISGSARVDCGATRFVVDDARDVEHGDLEPGSVSDWPFARTRDGRTTDLRELPPDGTPRDRFGYCTDFDEGWFSIANPDLGIRVVVEWDLEVFPCAWYWLEARATSGAPWFGQAYVFAIEPASTWPGQGIATARRTGNGPLAFAPRETKTVSLRLRIEPLR